MRLLLFILGSLLTQTVCASTFVGNGGNAGDIELQVTLAQVSKSLEYIDRDKDVEEQNLCTCTSEFEGRAVCDVLKKLNSEQVRFCSNYMQMKAADLASFLKQKNELKVSWTHDTIEVQEEGRLRGADAVTNAEEKLITLNQDRFLEMNENERVFLIGHELFHLTSFEGKTLKDEGEVGPFKGSDGGRQLINAMAATVVLQANQYGVFRSYESTLRRSKSYKKTYVTLGYSSTTTSNNTSSAFDIERTSGGQLGVRHQLTPEFGLVGQLSALEGKKTILTSIEATENKNILGLGVAYRWFPFENPLSKSGQSHFVFSATLDLLDAKYEFHEDPSDSFTAKTSSSGYTVACNYFIPFDSGMWAYAGIGYSSLPYSFNLDNQITLDYNNNGTTFALGASYGF